jgi:aspartyl-tRNA(Asn)/glutamyl-tRNA(Gln) amidotransferase subunit C
MSITPETVKYIADLSRIALSDAELKSFATELAAILGYIAKLEQLDVQNVEPTSHALPLKNVYRADTLRPSLTQAEALSVAVAQQDGSFKVPQVIE